MAFHDTVVHAELFTSLPSEFRDVERRSAWIDANKPGGKLDSFLEGPALAPDGALWVADIPHGRIFRIDSEKRWSLAAQYDGWPNGMRWHRDGHLYIADYKRGIMCLRDDESAPQPVIETHRSEGFKGCNDLWFARDGTLFFTDQGQTGLHDPTGRVYRADPSFGRLEVLVANAPSPNGLVTGGADSVLFVA
ncbi:MAG: SMP-30/gluconolactonase/LRE family protein, partial [Pseudomonadota bacterium]